MEMIVQDHERRITQAEIEIKTLKESQLELKNGMLRVETTVLQEGQGQRKKLEEVQDKLMNHFFGERTEIRSNKARLAEVKWTTIAGLLGGGSAIALGVQWVIDKL